MNTAAWSKKLAVVVVALVLIAMHSILAISPESVDKIVELTIWYVGGQATVDVALAFQGKKKE